MDKFSIFGTPNNEKYHVLIASLNLVAEEYGVRKKYSKEPQKNYKVLAFR